MKNVKHFLLVVTLIFTISEQLIAQTTYANREWVRETPVVGTGIYHTSTIVVSGKIYVTGNVINGSGNTDIYTLKLDSNGDTLWSNTYNGSATGSMDYGIELQTSSDGYLYVIGAAQNSSTGYDYCLIKYSQSTGSQVWVRNWNGTGNGDDIPSALKVDGSSAIYVTGGSEATNGFSDYGTIKVSNTNVLSWTKYYNYNGLHDGATTITTNLTSVIVSGGSASAVNDWDIATVSYNKISGSAGTPTRTNIPGATMVAANAMITDSLNNIYITGYAEVSGNKNIQTIKLDSALALKWIADYEENGEDIGNDIGTDNNGNVYVTGYTEVVNDRFQGITIKYSDTGDTLWTQLYGDYSTTDGVKFRKMAVETDGDVYVTGSANSSNLNAFTFAKYDDNGYLRVTRDFEGDSLNDDGFDIQVEGNDVYITGFSETISGTRMTTIKYNLHEKDSSSIYDTISGDPLYVERDLLVRVDPDLIEVAEVNKLEIEYWELEQLFDSSFVADIYDAVETTCGRPDCEITVYRMFRYLTPDDTITVSRLGEIIEIPEFWATFVFEFPSGLDVLQLQSDLTPLFPNIAFATPNFIATLATSATDQYYDNQASLHPVTGIDSAHINIETAWDYSVGEPFVRVGVFDTGILWPHEDFLTTQDPYYTRISGGYDFEFSSTLFSAPSYGDSHGHGTNTAGVIGANRNGWDDGVAGIAGGNDNTDSSGYGCSMYSLKIINPSYWTSDLSYIADAIVTTAIDDTTIAPYGYGIHIANNSWYFHQAPGFVGAGIYSPTNITLIRDALHFANRAKVTYVCARGNFGYIEDLYDTITVSIPAVLDENWILCVGGTGTDGHYMDGYGTPGIGDGTEMPDTMYNASSRGWEIDVAAPACYPLVYTTSATDTDPSPGTELYYSPYAGTSAATPHVSGTVALLMSYFNEPFPSYGNLAPEDCENLIEMTAYDVNFPGFDSLTGHGRLNAGAALQQVDKDIYLLKHYDLDSFPDVTDVSLYSTGDTITINEQYQNEANDWFLPGEYVVTTYQINSVVTHNVNSIDLIYASWPRHSSSTLLPVFDANDVLIPRERITLNSVNNSTASLTGYIYKVSDLSGNPLGWWPFDTSHVSINMAYTLLIDTSQVAEIPENELTLDLKVYPNPTTGTQTISFYCDEAGLSLSIILVDVQGNLVKEIIVGQTVNGLNTFEVDMNSISTGIYFYSITLGDITGRTKTVKTN